MTHGEDMPPRKALAECIRKQHKIKCILPKLDEVGELQVYEEKIVGK